VLPALSNPAVAVATTTWRTDSPVDPNKLKAALKRSRLLRAKGTVVTAEGAVRVHLAGGRVEIEAVGNDIEPLNAIVLIAATQETVDAVASELDTSTQHTLIT